MLLKMSQQEMENIVGGGGEWLSAELVTIFVSVLAILVAVYKMSASTKGGVKIGNDYNFYWD